MDFETTMVNVRGRIRAHEKSVMVDMLFTTVDVREQSDVLLPRRPGIVVDVEEVAWDEVKVSSVERYLGRKVGYAKTKVTKLFVVEC